MSIGGIVKSSSDRVVEMDEGSREMGLDGGLRLAHGDLEFQ